MRVVTGLHWWKRPVIWLCVIGVLLGVFDVLRQLDKLEAAEVCVHAPEPEEIGLAVYNRLLRAAAFRVVKL